MARITSRLMNDIPLEDLFEDLLSKGMRGLGLTLEELSKRSGVSVPEIQRMREGAGQDEEIKKIATVLSLNPVEFLASAKGLWKAPAVSLIEGLEWFQTSFGDMKVNSYLIKDPESNLAAAFDTGSDCTDVLDRLTASFARLTAIFLTHSHGDHIFDLDRLKEKTGAPAWIGEGEPLDGADSFAPGTVFRVGSLTVKTALTRGHSPGGITYVIEGLENPVAIVGDAVFAGSIGGTKVSHPDALATIHSAILTLPGRTILCPGHGPLTTVEWERQHNPFLSVG